MERDDELTIDELARETGMTVRNIRAHQARGLLPPPEVRARTGFYGQHHVDRLRLIADMQAEGFNLKAIERILESEDQGGQRLLAMSQAARDAFLAEEPEFATAADLAERFGNQLTPEAAAAAVKAGLLVPLGDDRFEVPSPVLLRAGEEMVALGIPMERAISAADTITRQSKKVATTFIKLFIQEVLEAGDPDHQDWDRNQEALDRLRPLAAEAVNAAFRQSMAREIEREVAKRLG